MVFNGHDHDYERSEVNGVAYIVTGGYGAPLYPQSGSSTYSKFFASVNHFCVVDITGASLTMTVINSTGGTVETVSRTSTGPPVSYIVAPANGETIIAPAYTIQGRAAAPAPNTGIRNVEVSLDGGQTWHAADGATDWSYTWNVTARGNYTIKTRATDLSGGLETTGDSKSVTVSRTPSPELQHYSWDLWLSGGNCGSCHVPPNKFMGQDYRRDSRFCISCHNGTSIAHDKPLHGDTHRILADITAAGKTPVYGNITAGEYNNQPFSRLVGGNKISCVTCHNTMSKTEDSGRTREMTTTVDNRTYTVQWGGWAGSGYLIPRVYRDTSLWGATKYSKSVKRYIVNPSEYTYDENAGTITFASPQNPAAYIYVTLDYPYLRAGTKENALCSDCHTQTTHKGLNCLVCHQEHGSDNIAGIRKTIRTTDRTEKAVAFLRYTGSGSFADSSGALDGICEVCHTQTLYYRRDGSGAANHANGNNYSRSNCVYCHKHENGFSSN